MREALLRTKKNMELRILKENVTKLEALAKIRALAENY